MKKIKKVEIIITSIFLIISILGCGIVYFIGEKSDKVYARITVNGKEYKKIRLDNHKGEEELEIKSDLGLNKVKIINNKIGIIDANCKDKLCKQHGYIYKIGQTIVCLPNKVIIEIKELKN